MANDTRHETSMSLPFGNVVLRASGKLFMFPKAILSHHSTVFASMFDVSAPQDDTPIDLDDPAESFELFWKMLFTPLKTCLNPSHSSTSDLKTLLPLWVLLRKYEVEEYELHVRSLVEPLIDDDTIRSRLDDRFTAIDLYKTGLTLDSELLRMVARNTLMAQVWDWSWNGPFYDILLFGIEQNDNIIIGAAYYRLLIAGESVWSEQNVANDHREKLQRAVVRCAEATHLLFRELAQGSYGPMHPLLALVCSNCSSSKSGEEDDAHRNALRAVALHEGGPWYDVIGKAEVAAKYSFSNNDYCYSCDEYTTSRPTRHLEKMKQDVHLYFQDPPPSASEQL